MTDRCKVVIKARGGGAHEIYVPINYQGIGMFCVLITVVFIVQSEQNKCSALSPLLPKTVSFMYVLGSS